jgi:lipopolysaccharide export system protein LptA
MRAYLLTCLVINLFSWPLPSQALESDRNEPVHIQADEGDIQRKSGVIHLKGQFFLKQGSTELEAEQLTAHIDSKNKLTYAIAKGDKLKQAHYKTRVENKSQGLSKKEKKPSKPSQSWLNAYADTLEWLPDKQHIILTGNAYVQHDYDQVRAPQIIYDVAKQHVVTSGGKQGGRTTFLLKK